MTDKEIRPYGTWPSRVTPEWTGDLREFSELSWSGDGRLLWVERHSRHSSLMAWDPRTGQVSCLSGEINVGGGLMYGGGSYHAGQEKVVFIARETGSFWLITSSGQECSPLISSSSPKASPRLSPFGNHLVFFTSEGIEDRIIIQELIEQPEPISLRSSPLHLFNFLRWHPFGNHIAWISWDNRYQPWDRAHLNFGELRFGDRRLPELKQFHTFYEDQPASLLQPEFSPDGKTLTYLADLDGWWQIYLYHIFDRETRKLTRAEADHALPPWLQNQTFYGFSPDSRRIYCTRYQGGFAALWTLDLDFNIETRIRLPEAYTWLEWLAVSPREDWIALVASGGGTPQEIIIANPRGEHRVIRRASENVPDQGYFSLPEPKTLKPPCRYPVHSLFYPPRNPEFAGDEKPPLLVMVHSGPTRQKYAEFEPRTQYFTSRGYAVLEVNYRGSTGYGREYWEALQGQWGVLDVEDVYRSVRTLARQGLIDSNRIALLGSSSGGLTVLGLLVKYPGFFRAGVSLYGVTNLLELVKDPPKFERYYHHWLVGDPVQDAEVYRKRSPLFSADRIRTPVAIFQGGQDPIVPVEQAEQIVAALQKNRVPCEYHLYPEEGHGFKQKENVADFYQKTEVFLRKYLYEPE